LIRGKSNYINNPDIPMLQPGCRLK